MDVAVPIASTTAHARYGIILERFQAGDASDRRAGADELVTLVAERLQYMARRMLRGFPAVRRFNETDDIAQGLARPDGRLLGNPFAKLTKLDEADDVWRKRRPTYRG